jgi:hypothetical protein
MDISMAHRERAIRTITPDVPESVKTGAAAQVKAPEIQAPEFLAIEDTVAISAEAKSKSDDFQNMLDEMRNEMKALREGLKQAREAGEGAAKGWRDKIKCLQIAMRIMSGDKVPLEDHRFLRDRDSELYAKAIKLRIEKEDPKEYDRLSDDEETDDGYAVSGARDAAPVTIDAQPAEAAAQPAEG